MAVNKGTNITGYVFPNVPGNWSPEEKRFALALRGLFDQLYTRTRGLDANYDKDSYDSLKNHPLINGVELKGNKSASEFGIHSIPSGGGMGKVLTKESFDDYDVVWMTDYGGTGMFYVIAPNYATLTFPVSEGQHCIHDGYLFTAKQDISTSEEWTAAHWDMTEIGKEIEDIKAGSISDVQVNGTSILSQGVANVPAASIGGSYGAVKLAAGLGLGLSGANNLLVATAIDAAIKGGTNSYTPITPYNQEKASFYGLAKAAGADMTSSSNPVGTYTDAAKDKIMKMLGIIDIIATYESTGVASRAYATGECFIQNGKLFRATTNIVIGESFSSLNCEQTTLMAEITR